MKRSFAGAVAAAVTAVLLSTPATAHADGETFTSVPLPFFWPKAELQEVAADDAGGVWVGGAQGAYCVMWGTTCGLFSNGNPVLRRWNGSSWAEYPLRGWTGEGQIRAVTSSGGETWIGGGTLGQSGSSNYLARFDGTAFQKVERPTEANLDVISTGPAGTWVAHRAIGDGPQFKLHKRTGSTWTGYDIALRSISDLQALTATDAWAVGSRYPDSGPGIAPAIAHFDGTAWTAVTPPPIAAGVASSFLKVAPVGPNDVWALSREHLTHWNGTEWTVIPLPSAIPSARDLAVDGNGHPWVTADYGAPVPYRYSGGTWHPATIPAGKAMRAITPMPGTSTIWGVANREDRSNPAVLKNG
ncbi:hypothetical protein E1200_30020 [Actinomadura sp. GC306]|uniref:hypothetical protein n=1 Tax=Actinomadura sp. GC306 TaxID=2530367 RepID=UPI00104BF860|nr:hypothetical protein [Actinomadura sp. GC306]TDC60708.1 hypothetical protein E1200_30020 [Actinomadura sp. GC306]